MFQTKFVEKIKTQILFAITFFLNIVPSMRYWVKMWYIHTGHK